MIHPLLALAATQPQLLIDHAEAYAELASAELALASTGLRQRVVWAVGCLACVVIALALAGVALMLWAVSPPADIRAPWALLVAPLLPLLLAIGCGLAARPSADRAFHLLRQQMHADMRMLREAVQR